ncbi:GntR family transcriptional regulator [Martelella alba]|uniref:GntR family transcriptional regulator n=1 Tax=Martelella alba TaxID=2590451 RepID=A0ABY2SHB6_9HYPH|nr:GntR family transcriptional regulator [Martelella alba]TKI04684.1 GntR family transcriptional regulator [Martelella alba]
MKVLKEGKSLNETIYSRLRELILTGQLMPGHKLKITELAQRFGVSLNVVREALNRLTGEFLVDIAPQQGFSVRGLNGAELIDLTEQRITLESIALRKSIATQDVEWQARVVAAHHRLVHTPQTLPEAPDRLNPEWHSRHEDFNFVMMENCGSNWLFLMVKQLAEAFAIYQRVLLPATIGTGESSSEHNDLLHAILNGHSDKAVQILSSHLVHTRDVMLNALEPAVEPTLKPSFMH